MASTMIHMAVAKCIGDIVGKNSKAYFLGTIAPDMSKIVGEKRSISHFEDIGTTVPNLERFIKKYQNFLQYDFEFGYLIHLYTDKYWVEEMISNLIGEQEIKLLDGTIIVYPKEKVLELIYNDYTNINISLIEAYELDLSLFYDEFDYPETVIEEVPKKFRKLLDKESIIVENSKGEKSYLFDMNLIYQFIEKCSFYILEELRKNQILIKN